MGMTSRAAGIPSGLIGRRVFVFDALIGCGQLICFRLQRRSHKRLDPENYVTKSAMQRFSCKTLIALLESKWKFLYFLLQQYFEVCMWIGGCVSPIRMYRRGVQTKGACTVGVLIGWRRFSRCSDWLWLDGVFRPPDEWYRKLLL